MNLTELQNKRNAITKDFDALQLEVENWPAAKLPVPKEKSDKLAELRLQIEDPQVQQLVRNVDEQIKLVTQLNNQFRLALLQVLWDQVRFQLQSLAADENKRSWWWQDRPVNECLRVWNLSDADSNALFAAKLAEPFPNFHDDEYTDYIEKRITHVRGSMLALTLCDASQTVLDQSVTDLLALVHSEENSDPVEAVENSTQIKDPILKLRCQELIQKTREKEEELKGEFQRKNEVKITEKTLGLDKLPKAEKLKHERLVLEAREPRLLNSVALIDRSGESPAIPIAGNGASREVSPVAKKQPIMQPSFIALNGSAIKSAIAKLYNFTGEFNADALKVHVKKAVGGWWLWPPLEYKTVSKLLDAAEHPELLNEAALVDMRRRIDRLSKLDKFAVTTDANRNKAVSGAFKSMRVEVDKARNVSALMNVATTLDQHNFTSALNKRETELATYSRQIEQAEQLPDPLDISAIEEKQLDKKSLPELQEYATNIFQVNLSKMLSGDQRVEAHVFLPDSTMLERLETLQDTKSLYFVALILVMALNRTQKTGYDYEVLQQLLMAIFNGKYNRTVFEPENEELNIPASTFKSELKTKLSDVGMEWLLGYFPDQITNFSKNDRLKRRLLEVYPEPEPKNKYSESMEFVRSNSDERKNSHEASSSSPMPSRSTGVMKSLNAVELDQKLATTDFNGYQWEVAGYVKRMNSSASVEDVLQEFADPKIQYNTIFQRHFDSYPQAPRGVLLFYSLLVWFFLEKRDEEGQNKKNTDSFRARHMDFMTSLEKWLSPWKIDSKESPSKGIIKIALTNKKSPPAELADASFFKSDKDKLSENLYRKADPKKLGLGLRWTSADELIDIVYELFPERTILPRQKIANRNTSNPSSVASASPVVERAPIVVPVVEKETLSKENFEYVKKVRDQWARAINSNDYDKVEPLLRENMKRFQTADKDILAIYTLLQWYTETSRGIEIFGKLRPNEKADDDFRKSYKRLLTRLECAAKRSEKVTEKAIMDLLESCQPPAKEPYKNSNSLQLLFARIKTTLASSSHVASVKASPASSHARSSIMLSSSKSVKNNTSASQLGEGARRYLDQEESVNNSSSFIRTSLHVPRNSIAFSRSYSSVHEEEDCILSAMHGVEPSANNTPPDTIVAAHQSQVSETTFIFSQVSTDSNNSNIHITRASSFVSPVKTNVNSFGWSIGRSSSASNVLTPSPNMAVTPPKSKYSPLPTIEEHKSNNLTSTPLTTPTLQRGIFASSFEDQVVKFVKYIASSETEGNTRSAAKETLSSDSYKAVHSNNKPALVLLCVLNWYSDHYAEQGGAIQCASIKTSLHYFLAGKQLNSDIDLTVIKKDSTQDALEGPTARLNEVIEQLIPGKIVRSVASSANKRG